MSRDALLVTLLVGSIAVVGSNAMLLGPILGDVASAFGVASTEVVRATSAYGAATALAALVLGPAIDRLGAARALRLGMATLAAALALSGLALAPWHLTLAQALAGVGAGLTLPSTYALANATAPPGQEGRRIGRVLTGWSVSMVVGVPVAGIVAEQFGWRACYGALSACAGLGLLGLRSLRVPETRSGEPRRPTLALLTAPTVTPLLSICLLFMISFYGAYAFLGEHARAAHGLGSGGAGMLVLLYGVGFGIGQMADPAVHRLGAARALAAALTALALLFGAIAAGSDSLWALASLILVWGVVNHLGLTLIVAMLGAAAPGDQRGAVLGLNSAVTYLGVVIGTSAAAPLYSTHGFSGPIVLSMICCLLAALIAHLSFRRPSSLLHAGQGAIQPATIVFRHGERDGNASRSTSPEATLR